MENREGIIERLMEHLKLEEEEVTQYSQAVNRVNNPVLGIFYRTVLEDSKRHIHILRTVISYIKEQEEFNEPFVKKISDPHVEEEIDPDSEERLEQLLQEERKMIKDPFVDLLLESIAMDEHKHATLGRRLLNLFNSSKK